MLLLFSFLSNNIKFSFKARKTKKMKENLIEKYEKYFNYKEKKEERELERDKEPENI